MVKKERGVLCISKKKASRIGHTFEKIVKNTFKADKKALKYLSTR